jgi:hypothetical protein
MDEKGYEFGVPAFAMATSIPDFLGALGDAKVRGCVYGVEDYPELGHLPVLRIVAERPSRLEEAFSDLNKRAQPPGGDNVALGILFEPSGGYRLSISIDPEDLTLRLLAGDYLHSPIAVMVAWNFRLRSTDPGLQKIRQWKEKNPLYPLLVGGASMGIDASLRPVGPTVPFFNVVFSENTTGKSVRIHPLFGTVHTTRRAEGPPKYSADQVRRRRREVLRRYFPLTAGRFAKTPASQAEEQWKFIQALCNLTLSKEMLGHSHYVGIGAADLSRSIEKHLRSRIESKSVQ